MGEQIKAVRGIRDLLPEELGKWRVVETAAAALFEQYGFEEIRVPVIEEAGLFRRSVGDGTDIVQKEMYVFSDKKGRSLALRPEATASVARAYVEHRLFEEKKITRFCYAGPMFRYDRPQKGRYRQFYQTGAEVFGGADGRYDAELMVLLAKIIAASGIAGSGAEINSIGCGQCKPGYAEKIGEFVRANLSGFCPDCGVRANRNVLRVLDCKVPGCREILKAAPLITGSLCGDCRRHSDAVREYLAVFNVPYRENPRLVRGLDYYTKSVFEFKLPGDENAVAGGGRYDSLISALGGPATPAVGFAIGLDRLAGAVTRAVPRKAPVWVVFLGAAAAARGLPVVEEMRAAGIPAVIDYDERLLKNHLKTAARQKAEKVLILGGDELAKGVFLCRNMKDGAQEAVAFARIVEFMKKDQK